MANVTVELPSLLAGIVEGKRTIEVEAPTLPDALRAVVAVHPELETHLFSEEGGLRQHVLCFLNERNSRWLEGDEEDLGEGDRITILQAVSGG